MNDKTSIPTTLSLKKDKILCHAGDPEHDLFLIHKGKLLVFVNDGTKVTPLAYLNAGEYFGELSFFDKAPRSAHVITVEDTTLIKIPVTSMKEQIPPWMTKVAQSMTQNIRKFDHLISKKGFRKKKGDTVAPLTIEEQRHLYKLLKEYRDKKGA